MSHRTLGTSTISQGCSFWTIITATPQCHGRGINLSVAGITSGLHFLLLSREIFLASPGNFYSWRCLSYHLGSLEPPNMPSASCKGGQTSFRLFFFFLLSPQVLTCCVPPDFKRLNLLEGIVVEFAWDPTPSRLCHYTWHAPQIANVLLLTGHLWSWIFGLLMRWIMFLCWIRCSCCIPLIPTTIGSLKRAIAFNKTLFNTKFRRARAPWQGKALVTHQGDALLARLGSNRAELSSWLFFSCSFSTNHWHTSYPKH